MLFHVSEVPDITLFEPRPALRSTGPQGNMVWAIDDAHLHTYLLPRNCPRIAVFPKTNSTPEDIRRFMGSTAMPSVLAIESAWLTRAMNHRLYVYELPETTFELEDAVAGHYLSRVAVVPAVVRVIDQPLAHLVQHDVELRVMPSLWELREAVVGSTMNFSITRMRFASPPPAGFVTKYPV